MNASTTQRPPLLLSRLDAERIEALLEQPQYRSLNTDALRGELERAEVVEPADLPRIASESPPAVPRDVFIHFISAAKERNPAAAMGLLRQLGAR